MPSPFSSFLHLSRNCSPDASFQNGAPDMDSNFLKPECLHPHPRCLAGGSTVSYSSPAPLSSPPTPPRATIGSQNTEIKHILLLSSFPSVHSIFHRYLHEIQYEWRSVFQSVTSPLEVIKENEQIQTHSLRAGLEPARGNPI